MAIWEKATLQSASRINVDAAGTDWVKFFAPQYRQSDGSGDYGLIGFGIDFIASSGINAGAGSGRLPYTLWPQLAPIMAM